MSGTTPERFALHVQDDGTLRIEIGHAFDEGDIAALVAAENRLHDMLPRPRPALEIAPR